MSKRLGRKRLAIDIPEELHEDIKLCAKTRNITMTRWILRACYARIKNEGVMENKFQQKEGNDGKISMHLDELSRMVLQRKEP